MVTHISSNILRSKGNQTMKFGQQIEYNMINILIEKSYTKCGHETRLRYFTGKFKFSIFFSYKMIYTMNENLK